MTYIEEQVAVVLLGRYRISILVGEINKVLSLSLSRCGGLLNWGKQVACME